jgi:hypothetical protein
MNSEDAAAGFTSLLGERGHSSALTVDRLQTRAYARRKRFFRRRFVVKKFLLVLLVLTVVGGFASAQEDEGLGLSAGVEIGFGDVADEAVVGVTPLLIYEGSFLDGALDISGDVQYTFNIDDGVPQELFAEEDIGYNLSLNEASTLTFALHNENDFATVPEFEHINDGSIVEPSVTYALGMDAGELAFTLGFPLGYLPDTTFGTYLTAGFTFPFGFGVELTANLGISPDVEYADTNLVLSYGMDLFSLEVEIDADDNTFKVYTVSPYLEWYLGSFTVWAGADFGNIGGEGSVSVEPYIGVKYSF